MTARRQGETESSEGDADRRAAVQALGEAFAQDRFGIDELERRIDQVNRSRGRAELRSLLADLPPGLVPPPLRSGPSAPSGQALSSGAEAGDLPAHAGGGFPAERRSRALEFAVWSGRVRRGRWIPARRTRAVAIQGGIELDLREAALPAGLTEIFVFALMGGIEIVVPPWVRVEGGAFAFMGGYGEDEEIGREVTEGSPILRISGFVMMGSVDVVVRYPGETPKDAKRRRKRERAENRRRGEESS